MSYGYIFTCKIFLILIFSWAYVDAQITVLNPSFEDTPSDATVPQGWHACEERTTPDILPGFWGVYNEPTDGDTYAGIITRENGTFESFGQRLSAPLKKGDCHQFTIDLAHSNIYAGYNKPIMLQVYIGDSRCDEDQLIYTSPLISSEEFKTYKIQFRPEKSYQYIILKAFIKDGKFSHVGNILLENMSSITFCGQA